MSPHGPESERDALTLRLGKPEGQIAEMRARRLCATVSAALGAGLLLALASAAAETSTIRGIPEVLDGHRMVVAGEEIVLADIEVPRLGEPCRIRGNPLDCGRLARAGLMDIVAGAEVACAALPKGGHRCVASRYDVAFGLVHAGWAVPAEDAPAHYHSKMREAQAHRRGLWSAQPATGNESTVAHRLGR